MFTFFTTNEANNTLPDVIKKYEHALAKTNEIKKIEKQLQMSVSSTNSFEEYVNLKKILVDVKFFTPAFFMCQLRLL